MLISFERRFIYIKTVKTGSTSVEMYFEPWCAEPGDVVEHRTPMRITSRGVVGARGRMHQGRYKAHLPASEMRPRVIEEFGAAVWTDSLKFCVVRNPWERAVSMFWMRQDDPGALGAMPFEEVRARFRQAVADGRAYAPSQVKHLIDGETVIDVFIRHERMTEDLEALCKRLDVPFEPDRLLKMNARPPVRTEPAAAYYDAETAAIVARDEEWEIARFGFTLESAA